MLWIRLSITTPLRHCNMGLHFRHSARYAKTVVWLWLGSSQISHWCRALPDGDANLMQPMKKGRCCHLPFFRH
jgi:hypothetical protein